MIQIRYKIIALIILALLLISCKTKYITSVETKTDTITTVKVIKIDKPQLNEIIIENICDSLGQLKRINYISRGNNTKTSLKSSKNSLILSVNIDSIVNSELETYKSSLKTEFKETIVEKRYIPKWVWYNLAISILLIGWIFRRFIPALNIFR